MRLRTNSADTAASGKRMLHHIVRLYIFLIIADSIYTCGKQLTDYGCSRFLFHYVGVACHIFGSGVWGT